jgi:class 3 adenylate cyclase
VKIGGNVRCAACGQDNQAAAKFCNECGQSLARRCDACGAEQPLKAKFCNECGAQIRLLAATLLGVTGNTGSLTANSLTANSLSPRSYTPKHLADKILQSKSALEGERKQVTVLFADVKGSMELAEQLDPEQWHAILDRFFQILTEGVHRFEGTVNQYTGDGIMALFGAPIAHEDHAQRACYAALHLRVELARYATEVKREHGVGFSTRMGINSGAVVVGRIGDDLRMDYTAQGHTVGLAQRMESLAEPNTCYLTATTAALVRGYFALDDLGAFRVKGVTDPVCIHRLAGIGSSRTRFDVSRARGLSRFVGRAADLRTLEDALEQSAAGNGQVVGIVADAGTGKSRLCFEFLERCRAKGMRVFEGRAVAHGRNIPFLPILDVFRSYFGITSEDSDNAARVKIAGHMMVLDQKFADTLPLLYDFLGVADPQNPAPRIDPEARQRQLIGVIRQVIRSASEKAPTVTMVEDLHWLDAASAEFLEHMVDARQGAHSLLLLNFRPEYRTEWMQKSWYRQIPLTPLDEKATAELLASLLGNHPTIASLAAPIHQRTAGNPFFIEEVAQNLIETKHVEGSAGNYRLTTALDRLEVPATVKSILASRIDRLPEREKRLLQTAAVIGKEFPETLLSEIAGLPIDELKAAIANLRRAELIYDLALYPAVEYAFKHPLTQEVALGSLLTERKRTIHRALAEAIERQGPGHLDERAPLLAYHWEEAGEKLTAARWYRRAAEWSGRTDIEFAARHWARLRALARELPNDREAAALGIIACRQVLGLSWRVGKGLDESLTLLQEGQAFANVLGDQRSHLILAMVYSKAQGNEVDTARYIELASENYRVALKMNDVVMQANASVYLVDALSHAIQTSEALTLAEAGLANFPRDIPRTDWILGFSPHGVFSHWRAVCLNWTGRLREGFEEVHRCLRFVEEDNTPEAVAYILGFAAEAYYHAHDADKAMASAARSDQTSRALGEPPSMVAYAKMGLAFALLAAGRPQEAIEPARLALAFFGRAEKQVIGVGARLLAEALLLSGDLPAAQAEAENAITLCRRSLRGNLEAESHGILARALLRRDGAAAREAAESALASAALLIERTGAKTLAPHLLEWRAELGAALGDEALRKSLLNQAIDGFESIGAPLQAARLRKEAGA